MEKYLENLITDVSEGNPGSMKVIKELMWFSRWEKMLRYFKDVGLTGGRLWAKVSDEYHLDFHTFGHAIDEEMLKYYHDENHKKIDFKLPKF